MAPKINETIISKILEWAGSEDEAIKWYCNQPIPQFGGKTAKQVVDAGNEQAVLGYIKQISLDGYA